MPASREVRLKELLQRVREGDQQAFDVVYREFLPGVRKTVYGLAPNHADREQLVQDVFIKAYMNLWRLRRSSSFPGWLTAIARNEALGALRLAKRAPEISLLQSAVPDERTEHGCFDRDQLEAVIEAYVQLPALKRRIIRYAAQGLSDREISIRTECSVASVKLHKHRIRKLLKGAIQSSHPSSRRPESQARVHRRGGGFPRRDSTEGR
ncbi:MAG: RNA polymerase sigma factor [Acidobacteriota bacterium]